MAKKHNEGRNKEKKDGKALDKVGLAVNLEQAARREGNAVLAAQAPQAPAISLERGAFDLDDPKLPAEIAAAALGSGGYPYHDEIKSKVYEEQLRLLHIELVKLQKWVMESGARVVVLFEGRDAAGKGGMIATFRAYMNPRAARGVALPKPSDTEKSQWYFQRYVAELPAAGEIVLFDRSWYNRAVVEPVMGFCSKKQAQLFLQEVPAFERLLVRDGIILVKFWLEIGREMQLKRFHGRRHDPLKIWKLSPVDIKALEKWDDYTLARDKMLAASHSKWSPWTIIKSNDKRRARLNAIRHLLSLIDYDGKALEAIGDVDPNIIGAGSDFLAARKGGKKRKAA